uniref:Uncharacterized protein n=1 Tax=Roseihalotalea indica TaxID=2867963 RepID=A0AA49GS88_9BACT|nr:hypothetical protein K4G66_28700 [Tunicatimonas sp. TK19036]
MKKWIIFSCIGFLALSFFFWRDTFIIQFFQLRQVVLDRVIPQRDTLISANGSDTTLVEDRSIIELEPVARLDTILSESSGLESIEGRWLWSHNDSGNRPQLIALDTAGHLIKLKTIANAENVDWEDLAQDQDGNLYVGDVGDNAKQRDTLTIYRLEPTDASDTVWADIIRFTYPYDHHTQNGQKPHFDVEAMCVVRDSLWLFSKNRTKPYDGYTRIYRVPKQAGTYEATLIDSLYLGRGTRLKELEWVTSADLSPDQQHLVLLTYSGLWIYSCWQNHSLADSKVTKLAFTTISQKEAVCFVSPTEIYLTDEVTKQVLGGRLYRYNLQKWLPPC